MAQGINLEQPGDKGIHNGVNPGQEKCFSIYKGAVLRLSVVQMDSKFGNVEENVKHSMEIIKQTVQQGSRFVVLPECCNTGYVFKNRQEALSLAELIPDGYSVQQWIKAAQELDLYIVAGLPEKSNGLIYNTAVLIGPEGYIGKYRKTHLFGEEKLLYTPGDMGFPVYDTKVGRIGMLICWDGWFPEAFRILGKQGADLVCTPTNWVYAPGPRYDDTGRSMMVYLTMAAAHANQFYVAAADRCGIERGVEFLGNSIIAGPSGWPIAGPASAGEEEILTSDDIDLIEARRAKTWNNLTNIMHDRRTDLYDDMLGYKLHQSNPIV